MSNNIIPTLIIRLIAQVLKLEIRFKGLSKYKNRKSVTTILALITEHNRSPNIYLANLLIIELEAFKLPFLAMLNKFNSRIHKTLRPSLRTTSTPTKSLIF